MLAIDEINKAGGVLGKQPKPVIEDGASDWPTFAEKARSSFRPTRSSDVRRLDVGESQGHAAGLRARKALLYYPVVMHEGKILTEGTVADVQMDETVREVYLGRPRDARGAAEVPA